MPVGTASAHERAIELEQLQRRRTESVQRLDNGGIMRAQHPGLRDLDQAEVPGGSLMMDVTLRYFDGCPNWEVADQRLRSLADELGFTLTYEQVTTAEDAERLGFAGSPTVLVDGVDPFATGDEPTGLACRVYATPEGPQGSPTLEQFREVLV